MAVGNRRISWTTWNINISGCVDIIVRQFDIIQLKIRHDETLMVANKYSVTGRCIRRWPEGVLHMVYPSINGLSNLTWSRHWLTVIFYWFEAIRSQRRQQWMPTVIVEGCRRRSGGLRGTIGRWRWRWIGSVMVVLASFMCGGVFGRMSFGTQTTWCLQDRGAVKPLIVRTKEIEIERWTSLCCEPREDGMGRLARNHLLKISLCKR